MSKKIKVEFYIVKLQGNGSVTFESIVDTVGRSTNDASRTIDINHSPIRLHESGDYSNFCHGDMVRIRMDEFPIVASQDGDMEPIDLDDDEGLGEETAFLYQIPTKVLMLQKNQYGVSAPSFAKYFQQKSDVQIQLEPVMQGDAVARMSTMQRIKNFKVSIAQTNKMTNLQGQDMAVDEVINLSRHFHSDSIDIEVSMGKKKDRSLTIENVINTAKTFFNHANIQQLGDIKAITISGDSENGDHEVLNLLDDWIKESIEIDPIDIRRIEYKERAQALRDSWENRRDQLEKMFLPQNP